MDKPVRFQWTDEGHMVPHPRAALLCDRQFVVGQWYSLIQHEERSPASHAHFFACIDEAWKNLPEELQAKFPSPKHLRKYALVRANYTDNRAGKTVFVERSHKAARRLALLARGFDEFVVVDIDRDPEHRRNWVVTIWKAQSQSLKDMNKAEFAASKDAALRVVSEMIGVDVTTLNANAGRAA